MIHFLWLLLTSSLKVLLLHNWQGESQCMYPMKLHCVLFKINTLILTWRIKSLIFTHFNEMYKLHRNAIFRTLTLLQPSPLKPVYKIFDPFNQNRVASKCNSSTRSLASCWLQTFLLPQHVWADWGIFGSNSQRVQVIQRSVLTDSRSLVWTTQPTTHTHAYRKQTEPFKVRFFLCLWPSRGLVPLPPEWHSSCATHTPTASLPVSKNPLSNAIKGISAICILPPGYDSSGERASSQCKDSLHLGGPARGGGRQDWESEWSFTSVCQGCRCVNVCSSCNIPSSFNPRCSLIGIK